jgi:hypothetical protein
MKDISQLVVTQVRIFAPDDLPFRSMLTQEGRDTVVSAFKFSGVTPNASGGEFLFAGGTFRADNTALPTVVSSLTIGERRVAIEVGGDSLTASQVFRAVAELLKSLQGDARPSAEPLILTQTTVCVARLDFDWSALFSEGFVEFASASLVQQASSKYAKARIERASLGVTLNYMIAEPGLSLAGIAVSAKQFYIEPRANVPLSERRYFTTSPTDSETHLGLLRELERSVGKRQAQKVEAGKPKRQH